MEETKIDLSVDSPQVRQYVAEEILGWKLGYGYSWYKDQELVWECRQLPDFLHKAEWTGPLEDVLDKLTTSWNLHSFVDRKGTRRYSIAGFPKKGSYFDQRERFILKNLAIAQAIQQG